MMLSILRHTQSLARLTPAVCHQITINRNVNSKIQILKTITQKDVDAFAQLTNDHNPIHKTIDSISTPIVHGAFVNSLVSGVIGTYMPGPGTIVVSQSFSFPHKCVVDKEIEINVEVVERRKIMKVVYECKQEGKVVFEGTAKLVAA